MIEACDAASVPLFVAYYRRAMPRFATIVDLVRDGAIGDVRTVTVQNLSPREMWEPGHAPWRLQPEVSGGGLFVDLGSHALDFLDLLLGPVEEVHGLASNLTGAYDAEDHAVGAFRWASGAVGTVLCWSRTVDASQTRRLQVAVAGSNTLAFLFRPARTRSESSAASLRLLLSAGAHGRLAVDLFKRRGTPCSRTLYLDLPRPLKWREDYDFTGSALARTASAPSCARSQRPFSVA